MAYEPRNLERWGMPQNYFGKDMSDYYRTPFGRSPASDVLEESNFEVALKRLGGVTETVIVAQFGHWLVNWTEAILIHHTDEKALRIADELRDKLKDYPILDEDHFTRHEDAAALELWQNVSIKDRIAYMREHIDDFSSCDFKELLACARGREFWGHSGTLLS